MRMEICEPIILNSKMLTKHKKQKNLVEVHVSPFLFQGARAIVNYVDNGTQVPLAGSANVLEVCEELGVATSFVRGMLITTPNIRELPNLDKELYCILQSRYYTVGVEILDHTDIRYPQDCSLLEFSKLLRQSCLRAVYGQ